MPKISVIVPVYKVEKYLDRCVRSLLGQTFADFEIILVDDGSPDNCGRMCDDWAKKENRIRVIHKKNGGLSSARNAGLAQIRGKFVSFTDSDDWVEPQMLQHLYDLLQQYPDAQMAQCDYVVDKEERYLSHQPKEVIEVFDQQRMWEYFFRIRGEESNNAVWNKLYRADFLAGFQFVETLNEDVEASFEFFDRATKMVKTNQRLCHYFVNREGITNSAFSRNDLQYLAVWDRVLERTEREHPQNLHYAQMYRKRANFTMLSKMRLRGYDKSDIFLCQTYRELKKQVRKDLKALMRWNMPLSRKMLLVLLCI